TEQLIAQLLLESPESGDEEDAPGLASATAQMRTRLSELEQQVHALDAEIDQAYASCFSGLTVSETDTPGTGAEHLRSFEGLTEAVFAALGRDEPVVMEALLREKQEQDPAGWTQFQQQVFSDRDLAANRQRVADALAGADIFFASLLFDYDQVEWLRGAAAQVPVRLVFESALELMSLTQ
ncbi:protoporphyrin IX magnesium chelatase, partial [Haematococcus lacustris]